MSNQLTFETIGGKTVTVQTNKKRGAQKGWAAPPGSGPKGQTCKTCCHSYVTEIRSGKRFWKCDLVKQTSGPGSDIRLRWPACSRWEPGEDFRQIVSAANDFSTALQNGSGPMP